MKKYLLIAGILFSYQLIFGQSVGINTTTPAATLDVNGDVVFRTGTLAVADGITVALDVNISKFSYYRVEGPTADFTIAGITEGVDGRLLTLFNRSGFTMQLNNEDPSAGLTDRIVTGTNASITITNKGIINLQYDGNEGKWIVKSNSKGGAAGGGGFWDLNGSNIFNNNTGNVGIGTNNPYTKLMIETPYNTSGWYHIGRNGTDSIVVGEGIGGVSAAIGTTTNHALRFTAGPGSGKVSIYPSGDVVIGDNTVGAIGRLTVKTTNNADGISHIGEGGNILKTRMGGTSAGIGTFSATNMRIFSGGFSRIFIAEATGNVGIGVADDNPLFQLDIGSRMRIRSGAGGSAGLWLNNPTNTNTIAFMGIADAVTTGFYGNVSGWGLVMNTNTGNVGIGTLNPTYKLSVNGDIRTKEVVVETGWADYVFDEAYKLKSLDEVEKYIGQNKHLPNIPSAKEVEEKGLRVGDIQKRMMEKIEELTLYIIEANKKIDRLEQIIKEK